MPAADDWQILLAAWNEELLSDEEITGDLPLDVVQSRWLGYAPASDEQIRQAERRLGLSLPHSYRSFLRVTNGWRATGYSISRVRPIQEVDWFRVENSGWAEISISAYRGLGPIPDADYFVYGEGQRSPVYRAEYLLSAVQISDVGDSAVYLLNPEVRTETQEWEAWLYATWLAGAARHRTFWDMMQAEYDAYRDLKRGDGQAGRTE